MTEAINIFFTIYNEFFNALFNRMWIEQPISGLPGTGIKLGYVMMCIIIMSVLIKNVLAIPHKGQSITRRSDSQGNKYWS